MTKAKLFEAMTEARRFLKKAEAAMEVLKMLIREANEAVRQRGCKSDAELKTVLCAMDAKADLIVSESYRIYGRPQLAIIKGWFYKTVSREREAGNIVFTPRQA